MAFFIVIGTDDNVQGVVDEIKNSHLQHNVITSGCIHQEEGRLFYKWTVYDYTGEYTGSDDGETSDLKDLLTNQISQFRTLLPDDHIVQVFVVSQCLTSEQCKSLEFVCDNLYGIKFPLSNVSVDLVLLGYDPSRPADVTIRPNWRHIKNTLGIGVNSSFNTNILYINNRDSKGGATNVDAKLLARFLCHWSKMVSSGECSPKIGVSSKVYSIGLAEYQYNFEDLVGFFELSAEERILDRTLNSSPAPATEKLCESGYFKDFDLHLPWLDGLVEVKKRWNSYCDSEYDYACPSQDQGHTLQVQKKILIEYLNAYLRIFVKQCEQNIAEKETEKQNLQEELEGQRGILAQKQPEATGEEDEKHEDEISRLNNSIKEIENKISSCNSEIEKLKAEKERNCYFDTKDIYTRFPPEKILTEDDRSKYENARQSEDALDRYLHTSEARDIVRKAISNSTEETQFPEYPTQIVQSIGRLQPIVLPPAPEPVVPPQPEKQGCIGCVVKWWKGLFRKGNDDIVDPSVSEVVIPLYKMLDAQTENVTSVFKALDLIKVVEDWWKLFNQTVNEKQTRLDECRRLMDGGDGYKISNHRKSHSLIEMDKVRSFRDENGHYQEMLTSLKEMWFDSTIDSSEKQTLQDLIKHRIIDELRGQYHTLKWDNTNPFVNENLSDEDISRIISETTTQADFFAEYIRLNGENIVNRIRTLFYFNDKRMDCPPIDFRSKYNVADHSLTPCYVDDFINSLCAVKVIGISDPVSELNDFKPKREYRYQVEPRRNYHQDAQEIVADAQSPRDKIRKIYDWLCDNIRYDISKTIHDADTAWEQKRGVCQAYCELFCALGESLGLTIEVVCGKSKNSAGNVPEIGHSWIYAFTEGYDGILLDPTWGAGGIDDGGRYHKGTNEDREMWFDVHPARMIYTHYPEFDYWQLQTPKITEEQFSNLPVKYPSNGIDATEELASDLSKL